MRALCHFVPVLVVLLVVGCFESHGRPGHVGTCSPPAGTLCCRDGVAVDGILSPCPFECPPETTRVLGGSCFDVPPPPPGFMDAGSPPMCAPDRANASCSPGPAAEAGRPFVLPVSFATCGCCPRATCTVDAVPRSNTILLTSGLCPDPCDCDGCGPPPEALCDVPALPAGNWDVVVNGVPAFTLPVRRLDEGAPWCATFADADACDTDGQILARTSVPDRVCVRERAGFSPEQASLELMWSCPSCADLFGPCDVTVEPRLTDDLPPGAEIFVNATMHVTECDVACDPVCTERTRECFMPPLQPGDLYRVWFEGRVMHHFVAGESEETCGSVALPVPG